MPVKSILTYLDGSSSGEEQFGHAIEAARKFDAHLRVAALGFEPELPVETYAVMSDLPIRAELSDRALSEAREIADKATRRLEIEGVRGDAFPLVATPSGMALRFGRQARYIDLVVLGKPVGDALYQVPQSTFEGALFNGDGAVLICPVAPKLAPRRAMIGWDGGPSVLRAVRRAYPMLAGVGSRDVDIVLVDGGADKMLMSEDLAVMLARYGLSPIISRVDSDGLSDAEALVRHQVETGADFMICGAYSHSWFRELLLGGVTRVLPGLVNVPLFMAH
ncbi:universal stress protein [Mameliella sp. AT18]|uniref:universal stress protein n=1 Tax=Mameliella sp. AT18 TaxID=3028385 RepID=UPI00237C3218|nr:universal stress protein [Mameliella sp. AT18]MDD9732358.1 universal stress protein [Mameliella sp. AT18]